MQTLDLKQGLMRLYYALWGIGAGITLMTSVYACFVYQEYVYLGIWVGLALIAPAVALGLIVWVSKGFTKGQG